MPRERAESAASRRISSPFHPIPAMKTIPVVMLLVCLARGVWAEDSRPVPMPRLKLDPVSHQAVREMAKVATPAPAGSATGRDGGAAMITMDQYVVREKGGGPKAAPKQEMFEGDFTWRTGGKIAGNKRYEIGFWPMVEYRASDTRLNVDFLHIKF